MVDQGDNEQLYSINGPDRNGSVRPGGPKLDKSNHIAGTGD